MIPKISSEGEKIDLSQKTGEGEMIRFLVSGVEVDSDGLIMVRGDSSDFEVLS